MLFRSSVDQPWKVELCAWLRHPRAMYVLTIDQARSRRRPDRVPELLAALADVDTLAPFERTVGDEVQGVPAEATAVLAAIRIALAEGEWHIGLGVGAGALGRDGTARSGSGPAFLSAREAVEAAKRAHTSLAVRAEHAPEKAAQLQALLRLIGALVLKRSAGQHEVAALAARGMTGRQIAAELGVSEQAISKRRLASFFEEEAEALPLAIALIEALDPVPTGAAS